LFKKLKTKWGIESNFQLIIIFIVFGLTGSASVRFGEPVLSFFSITPDLFKEFSLGYAIYFILRLVVIFPIYQILLIFFGTIFFQFKFFWEFEKKILKKMGIKI